MIKHQVLKVNELQAFPIREQRENIIEKLRERIKERGYNQAKSLTVVHKDDGYFVADGNHRLRILVEEGIQEVPCVIYEDGDIYNLAVQANVDEDTYAPMDLFDWLDVIGKLRGEGKTLKEISKHISIGESMVEQYSVLINNIPTHILNLCKSYQLGRVGKNPTSVGYDFSEGWFRKSDLYELNEDEQLWAIKEFLKNPKKDKIKEITAKYILYASMVDHIEEHLLDTEAKEGLVTDVYNGVYKNLKQLQKTVANLNAAWKEKNNIRILHGDAFELIKDIEDNSINLLLTDMPYNCSQDNNFDTMERQGIDFGEWDKIEDYEKFIDDAVKEFSRVLAEGSSFYIFANIINMSDLWRALEKNGLTPKRVMIWRKTNPIPTNQDRLYLMSTEMFIWGTKGDNWIFNSKYESNVMDFATITDKSKRYHPTQKPTELFEKLIEISTNPADIVLDPFSGSCTTGVCCKKLKRRFIGFEKDEKYYKGSLARLSVE